MRRTAQLLGIEDNHVLGTHRRRLGHVEIRVGGLSSPPFAAGFPGFGGAEVNVPKLLSLLGPELEALTHLHERRFVYRDVKPENVVVRADGHCALLDLAMSSTVGESAGAADPHTVRLTEQHRSKTFCGTPEYMAPEVAERNGHSVASDWWSLGVLLYELVAGVPPFFSRNTAEIYDMIRRHPIDCPAFFSGELKSLIARLLDRDANMRLKSIKDLFAHPFFRGLGRDRVARRESTPEFVPQLANEADTKYFSPAFTQLAVRTYLETPVTDDDAAAFRDYSYPPPAAAADDDGGAADDREAAASAAAARRVAM